MARSGLSANKREAHRVRHYSVAFFLPLFEYIVLLYLVVLSTRIIS